jgi:hypothetical protein
MSGGGIEPIPSFGGPMTLTIQHMSPLIALIAGVLILLVPRLLNYIVAFYLILVGLIGLGVLNNFLR